MSQKVPKTVTRHGLEGYVFMGLFLRFLVEPFVVLESMLEQEDIIYL